jgi:hypothetical protein
MRHMHVGRLAGVVIFLLAALISAATVFQVYVVEAPEIARYYLIGSHSTYLLIVVVLLLLLVNSNTRRPEGIDPNERAAPAPTPQRRATDAFAEDTAALMRERVLLPDGKAYGGRVEDDRTVVARLAAGLEPRDAPTPEWAKQFASQAPQEVRHLFEPHGDRLDLETIEADTDGRDG